MKYYHRKFHLTIWSILFVAFIAAFWLAVERLNQQHAVEVFSADDKPLLWATNNSEIDEE